jgi:arsenate reductase
MDIDLAPVIARQREAIAVQRHDLDRLDAELCDLELTIAGTVPTHDAREEAPMPHRPIRVLLVRTGNSARSQVAEALLERFGGPDFEVESAGTVPRPIDPLTVTVLAEVGIDWSGARSRSLDAFLAQSFDYVITVCDRARQLCPVFPGSGNTLHSGLEDPAEVVISDAERLAAFRQTRQDLTLRLRPFIEVATRTAGLRVRSVIAG